LKGNQIPGELSGILLRDLDGSFGTNREGGSNLKRGKLAESHPRARVENGKPERPAAFAGSQGFIPETSNPIRSLLFYLAKL
jgi:hypothetical protein